MLFQTCMLLFFVIGNTNVIKCFHITIAKCAIFHAEAICENKLLCERHTQVTSNSKSNFQNSMSHSLITHPLPVLPLVISMTAHNHHKQSLFGKSSVKILQKFLLFLNLVLNDMKMSKYK